MEKSAFLTVVKEWADYSEKYLTKTYIENRSKNNYQTSTYTLKITFHCGEKTIEHQITIDDYEHLSPKELNDKLLELEEPFYEEVKQFVEEKWHDISKEDPPIGEEVDLLVFFPTMNIEEGKTKMYRTYIIASGKYVPPNIITTDSGLNFEIRIRNMRVIYWNNIK